MIGEEGAELVGPMSQDGEDVRNESGLLVHVRDTRPDVLGQVGEIGYGESTEG